jgi:hypothetical protein
VEHNEEAKVRNAADLQIAAHRTLRRVTTDLYDEALRLTYAQMRREEGIR